MNPLPYFILDRRKRADGRFRVYIRQNTKPPTVIPTDYFVQRPSDFGRGYPKDPVLKNSCNALLKSLYDIEKKLGGASTLRDCWDILGQKPTLSPLIKEWVIVPMRKQIREFDDRWKLTDLTTDRMRAYVNHLKGEKLSDSTIGNHLAEIKRAARRAKSKSMDVCEEVFEFRTRLRQPLPREPLNWMELMKLFGLPQNPALDMFLLECFTGIRYSDLTEDVQIHETYLLFRQKKTGRVAAPALNPIAKAILERNSVIDIEDGKRKFVPHRRAVQTINRQLKTIAAGCGIRKNLSTHVGRHSYARLLSDLGVPEHIRAIQLGHSAVSNTQMYGRSSDYDFASKFVLVAFNRALASKAKDYERWLVDVNSTHAGLMQSIAV